MFGAEQGKDRDKKRIEGQRRLVLNINVHLSIIQHGKPVKE